MPLVPVSETFAASAWIDGAAYANLYERSMTDPTGFWGEMGQRLTWFKPYTKVKNTSFDDDVSIKWYEDGTLNAAYNCIDRHLSVRASQTAIIWEGDSPSEQRHISYAELHDEVCRFANALRARGVRKGDRVVIYMPMVPEAVFAMLACARLGAVHSVVFAGFSPDSLRDRVLDCEAKIVVTADEGVRGGRKVPLKANVDEALTPATCVETVVVVRRTGGTVAWQEGRDHWYHDLCAGMSAACPVEEMNAEDPLFILYTSGSTGKPKGVVHTTGGYLTYASLTHQWVLDYHDGEVYWCTADIGWVTGHSYGVYGPLANGATTLIYEGIPAYPDASRMWQIVDKHKVNIFYTAPTVVRALMREGDEPVMRTRRKSLRLLATVGEPINPEAWLWFYRVVGGERCPVIDTWWQTETGGHMLAPLPGATDLKPGSATRAFFGVKPVIVDGEGRELQGMCEGYLCLADSWPGQARTLWGDHKRFVETYFSTFKGKYFSGDGTRRDADGYFWITGRVDDVINVSGHRLGTAEIESALVALNEVVEAAVVGFPHDIKGQGIYAYVTLANDVEPSDELRARVTAWVRKEIGPIATPDVVHWAPALPKTRSGKIMRRILRKIAARDIEDLGDMSTLADPDVVSQLICAPANGVSQHQAA